jgi:hypothetical protein
MLLCCSVFVVLHVRRSGVGIIVLNRQQMKDKRPDDVLLQLCEVRDILQILGTSCDIVRHCANFGDIVQILGTSCEIARILGTSCEIARIFGTSCEIARIRQILLIVTVKNVARRSQILTRRAFLDTFAI